MTEANTDSSAQPGTGLLSPLRLPMRFSERRLLLIGLDLLAVNGALLLSLALRGRYDLDPALIIEHPLWFLLLSVLWFPLAWAFDGYDLQVAGRLRQAVPAVLKAALLTAVVYTLIPFLTPVLPSSRWQLFTLPLLVVTLTVLARALYVCIFDQPVFRRRVLIVGAGWAGRTIAQALAAEGGGAYHIVGFADDDPDKLGTTITCADPAFKPSNVQTFKPSNVPTLTVLGDRNALPELIENHAVNTLVLAITHGVDGELLGIVTDCLAQGVDVISMPVLYEELTGRVPVEHVGGNWYVAMPLRSPSSSAVWTLVKRVFDVVSAAAGALCLAPALPFIALAIAIDCPGPVFYTQERVGKGGRRFRVYKFRSMVPDAEGDGQAVWAGERDPRVTRVGRFLRKTHVDEFPQFLNILKGEMSAVGPRPERPEFVEELAQEIPFYRVRHAVKPGMAG
jgi:exopolysaccharide biosynthesis polyprenyl glycosylphosphotransferase